ncbi:MAG TPA: choice-of-anchor Q domain-containing protein, partial [Xanthomonadales bacterium]|nr:choice-of-anchor Q domain-containing protein [Xanthomonadales bacterium]
DNGGPTPTRALVTTGNEVDRGAPDCKRTLSGSTLEVDQRGEPRPADGDGDGNARCDKGAHERGDAARLTVVRAGSAAGTVTSAPSAIFCGTTCSAAFATGQAVTLTAAPSAGHRFVGWSGGCTGSATSCNVTMNANVTVTATFADASSRTLDVAVSGPGSVTSAPAGIACPGDCTQNYGNGDQVTLTAAPSPGASFTGWSGGYCSGTGTCTLAMDAAKQAIATFVPASHELRVGFDGDGAGTITGNAGGIACPGNCVADLAAGSAVALTAAPATGSTFSHWSLGPCAGSTTAGCDVTLDAAVFAVAVFDLVADPTLELEILGQGTVSSQPAGLSCPSTCSAGFARDSTVTLQAAPAAGHVFEQWRSGPCTGSGNPVCPVTLGGSTRIRAEFAPVVADLLFGNGFE